MKKINNLRKEGHSGSYQSLSAEESGNGLFFEEEAVTTETLLKAPSLLKMMSVLLILVGVWLICVLVVIPSVMSRNGRKLSKPSISGMRSYAPGCDRLCDFVECQLAPCITTHNLYVCTTGEEEGNCASTPVVWTSTMMCDDCCDASPCFLRAVNFPPPKASKKSPTVTVCPWCKHTSCKAYTGEFTPQSPYIRLAAGLSTESSNTKLTYKCADSQCQWPRLDQNGNLINVFVLLILLTIRSIV